MSITKEIDTIYQRVKQSIEGRSPDNANFSMTAFINVTLDALEVLFRPPSEEEVDAALDRIVGTDELAYKVAGAAAKYIANLDRAYADIGGCRYEENLAQVSASLRALRAVVEAFNEEVAE